MQATNSRKGVARRCWRWLLAVGLAVAFQPAFAGDDHRTSSLEPEQIRMVQRELKDRGYDVEVTSRWDEGTRSALEEFQSIHGLPRSGWIDPETASALGVDPRATMPVGGRRMLGDAEMSDPAVNCAINTTADCRPGP
jgi:hypothetical protein